METSQNSNQFRSSGFPFTSWNIDEVLAEVINQSAKKFTPDHWSQAEKVINWLRPDYELHKTNSLIYSAAELLEEFKRIRAEYAQDFADTNSCQNWFGDETQVDDLFFWYSLILFYDRMIQNGFINEKYGPTIDELDSENFTESVKWLTKQLNWHEDVTVILRIKEEITAKLSRPNLSNEKALNLLDKHLTEAQNQLENCLNWSRVVNRTPEEVAIEIMSLVPQDSSTLFIDDKYYRILGNYQRASVWNNFVNWLCEQSGNYGLGLSIPRINQDSIQKNSLVDSYVDIDYQIDNKNRMAAIGENTVAKKGPNQSNKEVYPIALMYMYLYEAGYFPKGISLKSQMKNEHSKYAERDIDFDSLYNKFLEYKIKKRIPNLTVTKKSIHWLIYMGDLYELMKLESALKHAKVDLEELERLNSQPRL